jgi:hypothetical protein
MTTDADVMCFEKKQKNKKEWSLSVAVAVSWHTPVSTGKYSKHRCPESVQSG